jgi:predicted nucleic acid-binding protein
MSRYVLDTSALLTLHYNEAGSARVAELLTLALEPETPTQPGVAVFACFMSLMEVLYRVWKSEGEAAGRAAYAACQALPVIWVHETPALLELAASLKARYPMSLGDAWIAAAALQCDAVLVHKDPEFEPVQALLQERLPYK